MSPDFKFIMFILDAHVHMFSKIRGIILYAMIH